ncbi:MAG: SsrA-binding protein [Bacteroidetes bacterium 24-39-8]|jgi:SsrA-binding protein|nr:MAG: SsrA-binding protein [Chitinophagaceae bacterium BSSC1]OYY25478.1 MAG: SsrA-binding protein [Sphingobacteriia bacterium 35-40-8]OYZ51548.1 MAG: SsrA-binding protein [Bacteroidetes bacterium 24-39-8]OZA67803.1 MAG: SsrA-binding protein [Sphingobacteriia bacterium 39-39-8]HQR92159.1 SsrA-binding protein [Sediminibacterium sp.]
MTKEMNNRQAYFNYQIEDKYVAGIVLLGTEVKSIREGKVSFNDSFCLFDKGELWVRALFIASYSHGSANNHIEVHDRKLLLNKRELKKLQTKMKDKGYTIVPLKVFFTDKNLVKIEIGIGRGKKNYDKRETIKGRDVEKEIKRLLKR